MIELPELRGVERDGSFGLAVQSDGHFAVLEAEDGSKVAVGKPEVFVGCGELDAVAGSELSLCLAKDIYAPESSRVIGNA